MGPGCLPSTVEEVAMSWNAVDDVYRHARVGGLDLLVLVTIAYHINKDSRETFVAETTLATELQRSPRQVRRIIQSLEDRKELLVWHSKGRGLANRYRLPDRKEDTGDPFSVLPDRQPSLPGTTVWLAPERQEANGNGHDYATFNGTYGHCRRC